MAVINVITAGKINIAESIQQMTLPAAEAILAGAPVRLDVANGRFTNANATVTAEARVWGIATKTVAAGQPVTAVRKGVLEGFNLDALAYDATVFLSNTDGRIDDAAGAVSTVVGRVIPATAVTLGTANDRLLQVDL